MISTNPGNKSCMSCPSMHFGFSLDRSQSLFYFVPQEKGLIWRPCWGWKNMGESNFHCENGPPQTKMHSNGWKHMLRVQEHLAELIFSHFSGRGNWLSKGHVPVWKMCCKMHQAALPIYIDIYQFGVFSGIYHKIVLYDKRTVTTVNFLLMQMMQGNMFGVELKK